MIFGKSITSKVLAALFIILLVGQSAGAFILVFYNRSSLFASLETRMRKNASFTAGVSSGPVVSGDISLLDSYLDEIIRDDDITSLRILDSSGKVLRERHKAVEEPGFFVNPFLYRQSFSIRTQVMSGGAPVGQIVIDYFPWSVNRSVTDSMITIFLYQLILLLAVGLIMMALFTRYIKKPVSVINSSIEKITMGDLSTEVPDLGEGELGGIARGISFLSERLSGTIAKLNSTASNVAMAIKQVNVTYNSVTDGMTKQDTSVKDALKSIRNANKSQSDISDAAEKLSSLSIENVSSLIELKATAEEIASNTQRLFKATEDSYSVVAEMNQTAKAISRNSSEALSAVEDTSASVEEVSASVREVEDHARESSKMAVKVNEITSDIGMLAIVDAVEGMTKISNEVKRSAEIIQRLGTRSVDIEKVLMVIKDVTEQTNLLSLNAAILAAQAGEHGKSFSVVADEISALSDRTASSTREIGVIVKTIQKDIKDAVGSVETANNRVEEGSGLVLKVGEALKEILTASEHSTEMTKAIERATEEQSLGLRQISTAIEEIRKMMMSVAKSTGEQVNALSYLLEGFGEVREVADLSKRGTEEQAVGTRVISKNLELASERLGRISQSVLSQKKLNDAIAAVMEQISSIGSSTVKDMADVSSSLNALFEEIEVLRKEMEVFKIG